MTPEFMYSLQVGRSTIFSPGISGTRESYVDSEVSALPNGGFAVGYTLLTVSSFRFTYNVSLAIVGAFSTSTPTSVGPADGVVSPLRHSDGSGSLAPLPSLDFVSGTGGVALVQTGQTEKLVIAAGGQWVVTSDATDAWGFLLNQTATAKIGTLPLATDTAFDQTNAKVAADSGTHSAAYVAVWQDNNPVFDGGFDANGNRVYDIVGRLYDASGTPLTAPFGVASAATHAGQQRLPAAASLADGNYAVAWQDENGLDGSGASIRARVIGSASGLPLGPDFQVNQTTAGDQKLVDISAIGPSAFAAVWTSPAADGSGFDHFRPAVFARRVAAFR